ncbi:hypothetical protein F5Y08DRAFT_355437 [Xylaria arbuscula]|nr:hypothetical protein F5Y08DRAFT_355437 [Xylaria arbuscula]
MTEHNLSHFNRLPLELRRLIWAEYALPRGPMLHEVSFCSFEPPAQSRLNILITSVHKTITFAQEISTIRVLMQVNRESREEVLAGRQLQRVGGNERYSVNARYQEPASRSLAPHGLYKFFFVKFDVDTFLWKDDLHAFMHPILDAQCLHNLQRVAFAFHAPYNMFELLNDRNYRQSFYTSDIVMDETESFSTNNRFELGEKHSSSHCIRNNLLSISSILIVIDYEDFKDAYDDYANFWSRAPSMLYDRRIQRLRLEIHEDGYLEPDKDRYNGEGIASDATFLLNQPRIPGLNCSAEEYWSRLTEDDFGFRRLAPCLA